MGRYTELLKTPGVGRIIAAQLTARFPFGMLSLAFLLHVERVHGSYAAAGLVLGSLSIGQAIAGPLTSRLMGRFGMRRVLTLTLVVCASAIIAMALLPLEIWQFVAIGFVAGLSMPPVQSAVRTIYPKIVTNAQLTPLFSLDASAQEVIWVLGPVLTTFVSIRVSTVTGILTAAGFLIGGGIWFIASPEVGRVRIPRSKRRLGVVLAKPPVLLATVVGFLLVGACAAVEAGVVAVFGHGSSQSGIVLAVFAAGSLAGGLTMGHLPISRWATAQRMLIVTAGMGLAAFSVNVWWLCATLFVAGIGIAPALAALFAMTASSVRFSETAEAYGWVGTGQLIGAALGSAIAGVQIDRAGPIAAIIVAALFALAGFVAAVLGRRYHPDLRGRDASPLPDTEPLRLPT
ncbi:MFS transporter [Rathayibacter toxicus]|uniref:MFS transporter n=1 Tax=Rathayibacter toxicus TaxID=145458 RepID=A0A2S5Y952_9MICO|nr:MFS transporter [Rathayibacter toxicus]AJM77293.1 major facilitator transporter [Rathayibacter toxicus]PPG23296.1 MFS transporter [Rathayibacter toxicus]PPG47878.1 MFS transporter [Rathayibacter toxicus]PPH25022.1 MFS transporter [Rathayibacter toxicus]PPH58948.1 MFS transporter [Rathayibacter toxicus]